MHRPSIVALTVVAAAFPILALAAPVSTTLPVPGSFERVALRGDFDVEVREGSPASIELLAEPGWEERIQVEVAGDELRLSRKRDQASARGVLVKVMVPSFRGLSVAGSGKGTASSGPSPREVTLAVSGSGELSWTGTAAALEVAVSGSGTAKAKGDAGPVKVAVSGSGGVTLSGKGQKLSAAVSGSGDVDAKEFPVTDASVAIAGSGDVFLRLAGGTLDARIAGSGDLEWWGEGREGAVSLAGSGRVRRR
jgi:hypothetical protein